MRNLGSEEGLNNYLEKVTRGLIIQLEDFGKTRTRITYKPIQKYSSD